jgi:hypothetical protein
MDILLPAGGKGTYSYKLLMLCPKRELLKGGSDMPRNWRGKKQREEFGNAAGLHL